MFRGLTRSIAVAALAALPRLAVAAPLPDLWVSRGPGGGGALFSPSFSPHRADELFVACDMSELFHTRDLGNTWRVVDFREVQGNRAAHVQFTSDSNVLYALDHSSVGGVDARRPARSADGGWTWSPLAADPAGQEAYTLLADPDATNRLLLADYGTLYMSSNGGSSFSAAYSAPDLYVAGAFFDGDHVYVGTRDGLLVSSNGGAVFTLSGATGPGAGEGWVSLTGAREGALVRLLGVTAAAADLYAGMPVEEAYGAAAAQRKVYTLDLGAGAWVVRTNGLAAGHRMLFASMARTNAQVAYVAGQRDDDYPAVYRTGDGGVTWSNVFLPVNNQNVETGWCGWQGDRDYTYDAYYVGFAVAPRDERRAALTGYGFVHVTTNGGQTWQAAYLGADQRNGAGANTPKGRTYRSAGLENTTCWGVTWSDPTNVFASYSDIRGARSVDGGLRWGFGYTGHTYNSTYQVVRHPDGTLYAAVASVHDLYQSTYLQDSRIDGGSGEILVSTNRGQTWQRHHNTTNVAFSLALDPQDAGRLYAAVVHSTRGGFRVTSNLQAGAAAVWRSLAAPPRTEGHPFQLRVLDDGTLVCTYSGRRTSAGAFTASSGIFVSTNGGNGWTDVSHTNMHYWTKDLVLDPYDPAQSNWYVAVFSGWGGAPNGKGGLYRTTNRGAAWTRISALDRVSSCTFSPLDSNTLFMTTETEGLWYSTNARAAAPVFAAVTNYPFRQPERVVFNPHRPREVWVTSFGHGLRIGWIAPPAPAFTHAGAEGLRMQWTPEPATAYSLWRADHPAAAGTVVAAGLTGGVCTGDTAAAQSVYWLQAE